MQQDCYVAEQRGPRSQERKKSAILTSNACASLAIVASEEAPSCSSNYATDVL